MRSGTARSRGGALGQAMRVGDPREAVPALQQALAAIERWLPLTEARRLIALEIAEQIAAFGQTTPRTCVQCGTEWFLPPHEVEWLREQGYHNLPARCVDCRRARRHTRATDALRIEG